MTTGPEPTANRIIGAHGELIAALDAGTRSALGRIWAVLPDARLVGGAVRDLLAGRTVSDIDLATPEPPETVLRDLRDAGIKVVATGLAHGTVTAVIGGRPFEVTTLREDAETDGRHARVRWTADWSADAARRDFTINAMSLARNGTLHDLFGGQDDLRAGRVRFVGEAARRIREDGLRILRFFRFQARFGQGLPDHDALRAIREGLQCLSPLSAERVWMELSQLLAGPQPGDSVGLMAGTGVLDTLLPRAAPARVSALDALGAPVDAVLRLAALANDEANWAAAAARRLRLSRVEARRLEALLEPGAPGTAGTDEDSLRRRLATAPLPVVSGRSWLAGEADAVRSRLDALEAPVFPLAGRDAVLGGLEPGPEVGRRLAGVRDWWLAGGCRAGRDACLDRLRLIGTAGAG